MADPGAATAPDGSETVWAVGPEAEEEEAVLGAPEASASVAEPELKAAFEEAEKTGQEQPEKIHGYVVSKTRGGRHRKLHHYGSCRLIPGVDYRDYDVWGDIMPPRREIDSKCIRCFGKQANVVSVQVESGEESLDSSSSSTDGKTPKRARPEEAVPAEAGQS